jgi:maltose alpha-D-glucosyltransferase / alpha-amylase
MSVPDRSALRGPDWFRSVVFYELAVRSFFDSNADGIGDLPGVTQKLDYLRGLGVGAIWLLPFYPSPWRDDGYDVTNHYDVDPRFGTLADLDTLVAAAHARGIRVIGDLVTNHVSDAHPWFQEARRSRDSPHRSWFMWSDTGKEFSRARVIMSDFESSNWTWDEVAGQYYFHRFYHWQPDLNYDNPAVRAEILRVADFWLTRGLDGFRCDAVPYLFKREGTKCQSLPEVHGFFQELRAMMDARFPGAALVAEANQSIPETVPYFGGGKEFQMVMQFPIMPNFFLALGENSPRRVLDVLRATLPGVPPDCGWAYFLRNHDELSLEQVSDDERELFHREYASNSGAVLFGGVRRRLAPLLGGDDTSVLLLTALILGLPGAPYLYYGDEIGMGDRLDLPDRDPVRTPMQWDDGPNAGFSKAHAELLTRPIVDDPAFAPAVRSVAVEERRPDSLLARMHTLIGIRNAHASIFAIEQFAPVDLGDSPVLAFWRPGLEHHILCLYNFSQGAAAGNVPIPPGVEPTPTELVFFGSTGEIVGDAVRFRLERRAFGWVRFPGRRAQPQP